MAIMRVLAVHNYYQQRGGEDQCFEDEVRVLRSHGHDVSEFIVHNDSIQDANKLKVAIDTLWSRKSYRAMHSAILESKPDVIHVMNTFPLLSPSIFYAAKRLKVPIIHEIANYRVSCANALLLRDGKICQKCLDWIVPLPAIRYKCYRNSTFGSAVVASTILLHQLLRTWHRAVDLIMCPSEIARSKLIESGLPSEKIVVKKNALDFDPGLGKGPSGFVVFVGRLSPEKGLHTLVKAWKENERLPKLKIIGDGPMAEYVQSSQRQDARIEWLGKMPIPELLEIVGQANCLVMPSVWYETFGRTTVEAFAKGTPVVGSRIGGTAEIIEDQKTGWLFEPGNSEDLAAKIELAMNLTSKESTAMRFKARNAYLQHYTSDTNYQKLLEIYTKLLERKKS